FPLQASRVIGTGAHRWLSRLRQGWPNDCTAPPSPHQAVTSAWKSLLCDRGPDVRTLRIDVQRPRLRDDDEVHILHRNGAEKDLIAHHEGAREADAVLEVQLHGANVRHNLLATVRQRDLLLGGLLQSELNLHVRRDAEMNRPTIREGIDDDGIQIRLAR